jgi:hypothetical protein
MMARVSDAARPAEVHDLVAAIGAAAPSSPGTDRAALEQTAAATIDTLLRRGGRLAALLDAAPADDGAATRLLITDLSLIVGLIRSLDAVTANRLQELADDLHRERRRLDDLLADLPGQDPDA